MAQYEEEESDYTEESYYEEVEEEEKVPAAPSSRPVHPIFGGGGAGGTKSAPTSTATPSGRPVHPLFGGAGAKNALAAAAANMDIKRAANPSSDPRPSRGINATSGGGGGSNAPPPSRPPHPLFGGGGAASLNDQIMAAAAKRSNRVGNEGASMPEPAKPKVNAPAPRGSPAGGGSLADQVAMMAARRQTRLQEEEPTVSDAPRGRPVPPPARPATEPEEQSHYVRRIQPVAQTSPPVPAPKATAKQQQAPKPDPLQTQAASPAAAPTPAPRPPPATTSKSIFQKAKLRGTDKKDTKTLTANDDSTTKPLPPALSQTRLKPTGNKEALVPAPEEQVATSTAPRNASEEQALTQWSTPGTAAPPSQKITRVTQSDPTYEIVEYKCYCSIM